MLGYLGMTLGRIDGILFLIIFTGYLLWMIRSVKRARRKSTPDALSSMQEERISLSEEEIEQVTSHINLLPAWKCLHFSSWRYDRDKYGGDLSSTELCDRSPPWTQPDIDRTYHYCHGYKPSGTCHFHCCRQKR